MKLVEQAIFLLRKIFKLWKKVSILMPVFGASVVIVAHCKLSSGFYSHIICLELLQS